MYQGICIANCESYATHPQRNIYRTLDWSEANLTSGYCHQCQHEKGQNDSVYLTLLIANMKKSREKKKLICIIKLR